MTWEIGKPGRELHTPGGLYLLVHELTARSRALSSTPFLWSVWRNGHRSGGIFCGAGEHLGMVGKTLGANVYASAWAQRHGLHMTPDR